MLPNQGSQILFLPLQVSSKFSDLYLKFCFQGSKIYFAPLQVSPNFFYLLLFHVCTISASVTPWRRAAASKKSKMYFIAGGRLPSARSIQRNTSSMYCCSVICNIQHYRELCLKTNLCRIVITATWLLEKLLFTMGITVHYCSVVKFMCTYQVHVYSPLW